MNNIDAIGHVTGRSLYLDDILEKKGTLYATAFGSDIAHGEIKSIDFEEAMAIDGVVKILTANDIPGENEIGGIIPDEPMLANNEVHFHGQPIALIIARDEFTGRKARKYIKVSYNQLTPIIDPREAKEKGHLLFPPRTFASGDTEQAWGDCDYIFEGRSESGGQEHLYIETQGAYSYPLENGKILIHSSTQGPTIVQKSVSRILGIPMHQIEVDVQRLGGAFGGKEDQATVWACMTALASHILQKPVKMSLHRLDDMKMTGKRHPYSSDFKIGITNDLKIKSFEVTYYQNGGAGADLSPAIMERTLLHTTNSYYIPNVKATAFSCRTNLPPFTAFRGFGAPQAMFVMESAIAHAAEQLAIPAIKIQEKNLLNPQDTFHYGQSAEHSLAADCWRELDNHYNIEKCEKEINNFNDKNIRFKKGLAVMPICFGISFTKTPMNQARALIHIYQDGSIGISTGAVEMGQGVNTKLTHVAAKAFSVDPKRIKLESTNTTRVANTSPTAASSGADLNGKALQIACSKLLGNLLETASEHLSEKTKNLTLHNEFIYVNGKNSNLGWEALIEIAFLKRKNLTAAGHYATPIIHFDKTTEKGHPFAYHVYGTSIVTVTVDCLRGRYHFDEVKVIHDFGNSFSPKVDLGQLEGGIVQGIGWMTMEELSFDKNGILLSNSLSTYKVPDVYSTPEKILFHPLEAEGPELAILKSKAVGEPPFMYGIGAYFAIRNAIKAFNPDSKIGFNSPLTPEKVLLALYNHSSQPI